MDRLVAANGQDIWRVAALQHDAQVLVAAVDGVAQYPGAGNAGVERRRHHRRSDLRLGGELNIVRNASCRSTLRVFDPFLGQIKAPVDQRMAFRAGVNEENADLTVLDPPCRAAVCRATPTEWLPFFTKPLSSRIKTPDGSPRRSIT